MIVTTFPWHWVGILGMPRRMAYFDYADPAIAPQAFSVTLSAIGGLHPADLGASLPVHPGAGACATRDGCGPPSPGSRSKTTEVGRLSSGALASSMCFSMSPRLVVQSSVARSLHRM